MQDSMHMTLKNRTGMQMSPVHSEEMLASLKVADEVAQETSTDLAAMIELRQIYIDEAEPLGTMPPPATAKGVVKTLTKLITGDQPQVFLDKLAERCAFERSGTRLYDSLLTKYSAELASGKNSGSLGEINEEQLIKMRAEENAHFELLIDCITKLGGDPTAQTPSADLVGVESMGLIQVVSDPRTSFVQSLHAVLAAELVDGAGWGLLITLAEKLGQNEMVERFREALTHEEEHLITVRRWYSTMVSMETTSS